MASRFRTRLKRICGSLQALLRSKPSLKYFQGSQSNLKLSRKVSNDGDDTESEIVSTVLLADMGSLNCTETAVPTTTPEPYLSWLAFTTGDPTPWKTPSLSEEPPAIFPEIVTSTAPALPTDSEDPWPFFEFPVTNPGHLSVFSKYLPPRPLPY
jgi:hypothetical protein